MSNDNESRRHLAKKFYKKFETIPDEKWCCFHVMNNKGQKCALGHAGEIEKGYMISSLFTGPLVHEINNGECPDYKQPTPKARILAALEDVIRQ